MGEYCVENMMLRRLSLYLARLERAENLKDFCIEEGIDPNEIPKRTHEMWLEFLLRDQDEHLQAMARAELLAFYKRQHPLGVTRLYLDKQGIEGWLIQFYENLPAGSRRRVIADACALAGDDYREYEFRDKGRRQSPPHYFWRRESLGPEAALVRMLAPVYLQRLLLSVLKEHVVLCSLLHNFTGNPLASASIAGNSVLIDSISAMPEVGASNERMSMEDALCVAECVENRVGFMHQGLPFRLTCYAMKGSEIEASLDKLLRIGMTWRSLLGCVDDLAGRGLVEEIELTDGEMALTLTIKGLAYIIARLPKSACTPTRTKSMLPLLLGL